MAEAVVVALAVASHFFPFRVIFCLHHVTHHITRQIAYHADCFPTHASSLSFIQIFNLRIFIDRSFTATDFPAIYT